MENMDIQKMYSYYNLYSIMSYFKLETPIYSLLVFHITQVAYLHIWYTGF